MPHNDDIYCKQCDKQTIHDSRLDFGNPNIGAMSVLCKKCAEDFEIVVIKKKKGDK